MLKGIDVSEHQSVINWETVKSQIDYAILRVGYGSDIASQDDKQFRRNADECTRLGIPFGVYIYSYATSIDEARSEASHVLRLIQGYRLAYPVYLDLEDAGTTGNCSNDFIASMAETFCNAIESAGYWVGIYANTSWFNNKLTDSRFDRWVKWVAQYASRCTYGGNYDMWQYCSEGEVSGIDGDVDMNYCYVDYPDKIQNNSTSSQSEIGSQPAIPSQPNYSSSPDLTWNYHYDAQIAELQNILNAKGKGFNLVVDGVAGNCTYAAVRNYTIELGDRGPLTKWVQDRINTLGFNAGYADGYAEQPTIDGIARFQQANGLGVGYLGGSDWYYLIK